MAGTYYGTQGGGTAVLKHGVFRWEEPPEWLNAEPGDLVPEEWGIAGPFNKDGQPVDDDFESLFDDA